MKPYTGTRITPKKGIPLKGPRPKDPISRVNKKTESYL